MFIRESKRREKFYLGPFAKVSLCEFLSSRKFLLLKYFNRRNFREICEINFRELTNLKKFCEINFRENAYKFPFFPFFNEEIADILKIWKYENITDKVFREINFRDLPFWKLSRDKLSRKRQKFAKFEKVSLAKVSPIKVIKSNSFFDSWRILISTHAGYEDLLISRC